MKNQNIDLKTLGPQLLAALRRFNRFAGICFFILVAGVYGFVVLRINTLANLEPTDSDISSQSIKATIPKIDPRVAKQLESMKDNSANVQTLFEEARKNPFQE